MGNVGASQETMCNITKYSINCFSNADYLICRSGETGCNAWKQYDHNSRNTLEYQSNAQFQGNLGFIFMSM